MFEKIRRALIVEDDRQMRALIRSVLKNFGCSDVIEVDDGSLAFGGANIVSIEDGAPPPNSTDIVFLDWMMPTLDGLECAKLIRSGTLDGFDAKVPIVMLTARTDEDSERRALAAGVTIFIRKPFSLRTVMVAVSEALKATNSLVPTA